MKTTMNEKLHMSMYTLIDSSIGFPTFRRNYKWDNKKKKWIIKRKNG
jgi:ribosomal protein L37E